jgi:hypothetical protein
MAVKKRLIVNGFDFFRNAVKKRAAKKRCKKQAV